MNEEASSLRAVPDVWPVVHEPGPEVGRFPGGARVVRWKYRTILGYGVSGGSFNRTGTLLRIESICYVPCTSVLFCDFLLRLGLF